MGAAIRHLTTPPPPLLNEPTPNTPQRINPLSQVPRTHSDGTPVRANPLVATPHNQYKAPHLIHRSTTSAYQSGGISPLSLSSSFAGPADNRASPETPTRKRRPMDQAYLSFPQCTAGQPPIYEGELDPGKFKAIPLQEAYNQDARSHTHPRQHQLGTPPPHRMPQASTRTLRIPPCSSQGPRNSI